MFLFSASTMLRNARCVPIFRFDDVPQCETCFYFFSFDDASPRKKCSYIFSLRRCLTTKDDHLGFSFGNKLFALKYFLFGILAIIIKERCCQNFGRPYCVD
ncbi:hypothetical protein Fot_02874 [Forsythia ovata]|uniref:Uncharacterized protein n=1 Tax=Forsythia ovata TaxID=205694 RepID=A0ABD1X833_9LAMI